jgi:hypothetical protein
MVALCLCDEIHGDYLTPFAMAVFESRLFDARLHAAMPDLDSASRTVLTVRYFAFEQMMREVDVCFDPIFRLNLSSPYSVAELLHFLKLGIGRFDPAFFGRGDFVTLVSHASAAYQQLDTEGRYPQDAIETARVAILLLVASLIDDVTFLEQWKNSSWFVSMLVSYLYEIPLRPFVLSVLRKILLCRAVSQSDFAGQFLLGVFASCKNNAEDTRCLVLMRDLLSTINSVGLVRRDLLPAFVPVQDTVCSVLAVVKSNDAGRPFVA